MTQRERMTAGEPYRADDPELNALRDDAFTRCAAFNAVAPTDHAGRRAILGELFAAVGERVEVRAPLLCDYGCFVSVGPRTFANFGLVILDGAPVTIGADVQIGPNVQLLTATHPLDPEPRASGIESCAPVRIGDGVWLGAGSIVCPGVSIGAGTTVGAGSVVTEDLPARVLAVGAPARVVRSV